MKNIPLLAGVLLGTLVLVIAVAVIFSKKASAPLPLSRLVGQERHATGSAQPKVTLVEFSDFQCPACRAAQPLVKSVVEKYPNDLKFIYRHFPLTTIHKNAELAANAAEAVGSVGKFWQYHDMLFERQNEWGEKSAQEATDLLISYAVELGVPKELLETSLKEKSFQQFVTQDVADGNAIGISATPTFFVNGQKVFAEDLESTVANLLK